MERVAACLYNDENIEDITTDIEKLSVAQKQENSGDICKQGSKIEESDSDETDSDDSDSDDSDSDDDSSSDDSNHNDGDTERSVNVTNSDENKADELKPKIEVIKAGTDTTLCSCVEVNKTEETVYYAIKQECEDNVKNTFEGKKNEINECTDVT